MGQADQLQTQPDLVLMSPTGFLWNEKLSGRNAPRRTAKHLQKDNQKGRITRSPSQNDTDDKNRVRFHIHR